MQKRLPVNIRETDAHLFEPALGFEAQPPVTYRLRNAQVLKGSIFDPHQRRFHISFSHIRPVPARRLFKKLLMLPLPGKQLAEAIWITDEWSREYFHWFSDALPRLMAAEQSGFYGPVLLPEHYAQVPFVPPSLHMLGATPLHYDPHKKLTVSELIVPAHAAPTGNYNPQLINLLRSRFNAGHQNAAGKNIYVSRAKAAKRKIINETQVAGVFARHGFEVHIFEDYTFEQQVQLARSAKVLAGLHGAGLTNMLFMPRGGKVLELRNEQDSHNNCFFAMAAALEHDYYYLLSKGTSTDTYHADFYVDVAPLEAVAAQLAAS
ncbi:glycosyltransferase family 61 protein [Chitinophaga alhagiae]|uniref:glycosyltransferase family 61 protein n=1 Tax=Chitinophaga alhagiae TaxID=2203219 RepID=UPI000E5BE420|nr:glycosyltransferase family 61 protein [Chitinophaga alhagiae]